MDQRWRDGSIKEATFTDPNGHYEYPTAEGGALGKWIINEQGFARFSAYPGPSVHDEHTDAVTPSCAVDARRPGQPVRPDRPGRRPADQPAAHSKATAPPSTGASATTRPATPGQIVGITYFATTRNEFDARIRRRTRTTSRPSRTSRSTWRASGPDGLPNTADDVVVNKYVTDHWQQPEREPGPAGRRQHVHAELQPDHATSPATTSRASSTRTIGPNCLEVPLTGEQTKDGAFDGGYAFADYCPDGYDLAADRRRPANGGTRPDDRPLVAGNYITHAVMPKDADRHPALQPGWHRTASGSREPQGRRPRRRRRLPLPPGPRGGRQRRPRQPLHARPSRRRRAPATTT